MQLLRANAWDRKEFSVGACVRIDGGQREDREEGERGHDGNVM